MRAFSSFFFKRLPLATLVLSAVIVFGFLLAVLAFDLGKNPIFLHDDYEYAEPAFSLAFRGNVGTPSHGSALNIQNRTYCIPNYYFFAVSSLFIRVLGDRIESVAIGNVIHLAALAVLAACFLWARGFRWPALFFPILLLTDPLSVTTGRHGRPEMTTGFYLFFSVLTAWWLMTRVSEAPATLDSTRPSVAAYFFLAGLLLAFSALSHPSGLFVGTFIFAALLFRMPRALLKVRNFIFFALPFLIPLLLFAYFAVTDDTSNLSQQMSLGAGHVQIIPFLQAIISGDGSYFKAGLKEFEMSLSNPTWLFLPGLLVAAFTFWKGRGNDEIRKSLRYGLFFLIVFSVGLLAHFLCLKRFVHYYQSVYLPFFFLAAAFSIDSATKWIASCSRHSGFQTGVAMIALVLLGAFGINRMKTEFFPSYQPTVNYSEFGERLTRDLQEAGAMPGELVMVPSPFGYPLKDHLNVITFVARKYAEKTWTETWRRETAFHFGLDPKSDDADHVYSILHLRPRWIVFWDGDYGNVQSFGKFLKDSSFPSQGLVVRQVAEKHYSEATMPYRGLISIYRVDGHAITHP